MALRQELDRETQENKWRSIIGLEMVHGSLAWCWLSKGIDCINGMSPGSWRWTNPIIITQKTAQRWQAMDGKIIQDAKAKCMVPIQDISVKNKVSKVSKVK